MELLTGLSADSRWMGELVYDRTRPTVLEGEAAERWFASL